MKIQNLILLIFLFNTFISSNSNAQSNQYGGSVIYNMGTKSLGIGLRGEFPIPQIYLLEGISVVPQAAYYPGFNPIHEFYLSSSVHLNAYSYNKWNFYGLMNLSFNGWINNEDREYRQGDFSNFSIEAGIGTSVKIMKCLHPFFEFRYNFRWNELNARLGFTHDIPCNRRGAVPCSKIPPQPTF
jgi:hypothetical protein